MPRTPEQFEALRADRKKTILDAALHVFAEEGYHNASISKVSKRAGVSKGLMYNYFESKEELLNQLLGELIDEEIEVIRKLLDGPITNDLFITFIQFTIATLKGKPVEWKLYLSFATQPGVLELITERYKTDHTKFGQLLFAFFNAQGHKDPALQMQYFFITFGGLKFQYVMNPKGCPIDDLAELIIKQFIDKAYVSNRN